MSERRDGLQSYHLIGVHPNDDVFIQPLNDSVPENLTFLDVLAFERLCTQAGARMVCTVRTRLEKGRPMHHVGFFNEPPSPEDEMAKNNALLRLTFPGEGEAEQVIEVAKGLDLFRGETA